MKYAKLALRHFARLIIGVACVITLVSTLLGLLYITLKLTVMLVVVGLICIFLMASYIVGSAVIE